MSKAEVVVITGASAGVGRATAHAFARRGARVGLIARGRTGLEGAASEVTSYGGEPLILPADVSSAEQVEAAAEKIENEFGPIDILVNNVGIGGEDQGPVKLKEEVWDRIFATNLKSMFLTCKCVLPVMEKQESGAIVNISSAAAVAATSMLAYKTSKAGVNALTHSIAMKYAKKGIRANCIMPGLMKTPMAIEGISKFRGISKQDLIKARDNVVPLKGGMGSGWDTAYAALFLASDEARFITAVILPVDGGQCAKVG